VASVLHPVGPKPPRVYWVRRAVLVVILLVLVVAVAKACSGGSGKPSANPPAHNSPTPASTHQTADPCDPSVLTLTLSTDAETYTAGQTPKFTGVFSNPSSTACKLTHSPAKEHWTVTSGSDTIWTTKGCAAGSTEKHVTMKAGGTFTRSIFWDGHRQDAQCAQGPVALPGTYVLNAKLDGVTGQPVVFHVTS
jgi:hypothetical protein